MMKLTSFETTLKTRQGPRVFNSESCWWRVQTPKMGGLPLSFELSLFLWFWASYCSFSYCTNKTCCNEIYLMESLGKWWANVIQYLSIMMVLHTVPDTEEIVFPRRSEDAMQLPVKLSFLVLWVYPFDSYPWFLGLRILQSRETDPV